MITRDDEDAFFRDPNHIPVSWRVSNWKDDRFSLGSWSQLAVNYSPDDRVQMGKKISDNLIFAGEACNGDMPSMVHGAAESGINAARLLCGRNCDDGGSDVSVVVIGAGAAGIYAAKELQQQGSVTILEARDRIGGRVNSASLDCPTDCAGSDSPVVDMGATWLQQYPQNFLAEYATKDLHLDVIPSDFHAALCASSDGQVLGDLHQLVEDISCRVACIVRGGDDGETAAGMDSEDRTWDMPLSDALGAALNSLPLEERHRGELAIAGDINIDLGFDLRRTSALWALEELGIGNNDHYIKQGYSSILNAAASGLDIRLGKVVSSIDYSNPELVRVRTEDGDEFCAQKCICTLPIGVLHSGSVSFHPPLPFSHMKALSGIQPALCEKVILRYERRWWPTTQGGIIRWYNTASGNTGCYGDTEGSHRKEYSPLVLDWVEWLDMTDGLGVPVVMGFCAGPENLQRYHHGTDEDIALAASKAFEKWAWYAMMNRKVM